MGNEGMKSRSKGKLHHHHHPNEFHPQLPLALDSEYQFTWKMSPKTRNIYDIAISHTGLQSLCMVASGWQVGVRITIIIIRIIQNNNRIIQIKLDELEVWRWQIGC